jgi:hypothetical protein
MGDNFLTNSVINEFNAVMVVSKMEMLSLLLLDALISTIVPVMLCIANLLESSLILTLC